ncbi:MAG: ribosome biogenesis GTPase Der [Planctomycetes bacterium]|nr:ribosome biogenesis GTPase Der [Planctomycetota bacterium]
MKPVVAIVGRPNVGKSTLLNRLARRRVSIVHPEPGVTRDRVAVEIDFDGTAFELIDTGGVGIVDRQDLHPSIHAQIDAAIATAQLLIFLVDARAGMQPVDREIADRLRRLELPVLVAANKSESAEGRLGAAEFHSLGLGDPLPISAEHGEGLDALRAAVLKNLAAGTAWKPPALRIAIVGRRNAGKSTFVNALLREERVIVSDTPGTTRDAVDVRLSKDGAEFLLIDTAGMQKRAKIAGDVDFYAQVRAIEAIERCDVALFLIDAAAGVSQIEKRIATEIVDRSRACVIIVNKWDLAVERTTTAEYEKYLGKTLAGLPFAPVVFISAKDSRNVFDAIGVAQSLAKQAQSRVGTGELNRALEDAQSGQRPRIRGKREPKILYGTQVSVLPPTIVLKVNDPAAFSKQYLRAIENRLREHLPFSEVPIRILLRKRDSHGHE